MIIREVKSPRNSLHIWYHRITSTAPDIATLEFWQGDATEIDLVKHRLNLHGVSPKGRPSSPLLGSRYMNMERRIAWTWRARLPGGQAVRWRTRRRIEATLVWFAGVDGALHGVIHLQDAPLGAVLAVLRFIALRTKHWAGAGVGV